MHRVATAAVNQTAVEGTSKAFGLGTFRIHVWRLGASRFPGAMSSPNTSFFVDTAGSLGTKSHNYTEEGNYTVRSSVTDFTSQTSPQTFQRSRFRSRRDCNRRPVDQPCGRNESWLGAACDIHGPGGPETLGDYSADIDWGDGTGTQIGAGSSRLMVPPSKSAARIPMPRRSPQTIRDRALTDHDHRAPRGDDAANRDQYSDGIWTLR